MNRTQHRSPPRPLRPFLLAALLALPLADACSSSSDAPATPITFNIEVTALDGKAPTDPVELRCDHKSGRALGTLAVSFAITSIPENNFVLRPNNACGTSTRCGYVLVQALSASDEVLGSVETASTAGLLELDATRLVELAKVEVSVIRGLDQTPLLNPDGSAVAAEISPSFTAPSECSDEIVGAGGSGSGGAGPQAEAGAAGESSMALGGAAGAASSAGAGGTAAAGAPAAGGVAGEPGSVAGMGGV
jgi:hypothetical protein